MTDPTPPEDDVLLTPAQVAAAFQVDPKTVTRWAKDGKLTTTRTLGGHRRYSASEVRALLAASLSERSAPTAPAPRDPLDGLDFFVQGQAGQ